MTEIEKLKKENQNLQYELIHIKEENARLEKENTDLENSNIKLFNDKKEEIRKLKDEIERLRGKCENTPFDECNVEELIHELHEQHQQDCIRYNDMRIAFLKSVDELAMLRKQFLVGQ